MSAVRRPAMGHVTAALFFAAVALLWTFPLARNITTHLTGISVGDNAISVWNFWWMRTALETSADFFRTDRLLAPYGTDLTLHTHTALAAFAGATALRSLSEAAATNVTLLVSLFLNGFCAYLLAMRACRDSIAALVGGLVFAGSPFIAAHLLGHYNLTTAWTIPLFAIAAAEALRGSIRWAIAAGAVLGATAYIDYYYVIYEIALLPCLAAGSRAWAIGARPPTARARSARRVALTLLVIDAAVIVAIAITGGFDTRVGPLRLRATDIFNPLQAMWLLAAVALWLTYRPAVVVARGGIPAPDESGDGKSRPPRAMWLPVVVIAIVFVAVAFPIVWNGTAMILRGDYVSQRYFWRSAPKGIDAATLLLGHPFHGWWGRQVQDVYRTFGIDPIEATGWTGIAPLALAVWGVRGRWSAAAVRTWTLVGAVFFLWALGPHLMAFGVNTGMILPQTILRYLPVVANARVPGRAMVVVFLAIGMLAALAVARARGSSSRPMRWSTLAIAVIAFEYWLAPYPLIALDHPRIYEVLRARQESGALCELPFGIGDGFGMLRGDFDAKTLFYQTIHGRPMLGGTMSRLPPRVIAAYDADPLVSSLMQLSRGVDPAAGEVALPDRALAAERLKANGVRFVMLNRKTAPPALIDYAERVLPLRQIAEEGDRALYLVDGT